MKRKNALGYFLGYLSGLVLAVTGCTSEVFPAKHVYQPMPQKIASYIPKTPETFDDAFGFNPDKIDRKMNLKTDIGYLTVAILKENTKIPNFKHTGRVWVACKSGRIYMGCVGDKRPFRITRYGPTREIRDTRRGSSRTIEHFQRQAIQSKDWSSAIKRGRVETPLPEGFWPTEKGVFYFAKKADWAKLLEFDEILKREFDKSIFPKDTVLKATAYAKPGKILIPLEAGIGQLERKVTRQIIISLEDDVPLEDRLFAVSFGRKSALFLQVSELEDFIGKYDLLAKTENPELKNTLKRLKSKLKKIYSELKDKSKDEDDPRLLQIKKYLGIKDPEQFIDFNLIPFGIEE